MLWTCLYLPRLSVEVRARGLTDERALAVTLGEGTQRRVYQANQPAELLGVTSGQALSAAYALAPDLMVLPRNRQMEKRSCEQIAGWAYRYSSQIGMGYNASVVLEISASQKLFGGLSQLLQQMNQGLGELGYQVVAATAPTPSAAHLMATYGDTTPIFKRTQLVPRLSRLPLSVTALDEKTQRGLQGVGIKTLGALLALPRAGVARRFDAKIGQYLNFLTGQQHEPQQLYRPPDSFESTIELPAEVDTVEPLAFVLKRLLAELCQHAVTRDQGVQRFSILLQHTDHVTTQTVGLLKPERHTERMLELSMSHLERLTLAAPIRVVTLQCDKLLPWQPQSRDLLDQTVDPEAVNLLFERLRARLGENAVRGLSMTGDPRPERAWSYTSPGQSKSLAINVERPAMLLAKPRPVNLHEMTLLSGPERIEAGWWDGADIARDYYIAAAYDGARWWVYQDRRQRDWYLHGLFA